MSNACVYGIVLLSVVAAPGASSAGQPVMATQPALSARVDPRIELIASDFTGFVVAHQPLYATAAARMNEVIDKEV